jgi:endoglucanase
MNQFGRPSDWVGTSWDQTPTQEAELRIGFEQAAGWAKENHRPLCMAEFGTSNNADLASRVRWTKFNRMLAEEHGMSWGIWSLAPTFAIYDMETGRFNAELLGALMEPGD